MLKSDYIRREHENTLLIQGYVCVKDDESGSQVWVDMTGQGVDIYHHVYDYPLYADEMDILSPTAAYEAGARYFTIHQPGIKETLRTCWVSQAIAFARTRRTAIP